jgi:hypothetical protein
MHRVREKRKDSVFAQASATRHDNQYHNDTGYLCTAEQPLSR